MDDLKVKVAGLVQRVVSEHLIDVIETETGDDPDFEYVEPQNISKLETLLRVKSATGPSRYFMVKVSEQT